MKAIRLLRLKEIQSHKGKKYERLHRLATEPLHLEHLVKAKKTLVEALCVLEIYFPPLFFVIMIHLMHHLPNEALLAGPPRYRAMWLFER
ncbi:hypothetical protein LguiA_016988 [Lonicera macranthoides]